MRGLCADRECEVVRIHQNAKSPPQRRYCQHLSEEATEFDVISVTGFCRRKGLS